MFSVLILNKKTTQSFQDYYPLFLNSVRRGDVAVCKWNESGSSIDSMLPEIHALTDDKPKWRAVIVRTEEDTDLYACAENNPYDYTISTTEDIRYDGRIPLLRLVHYLGGVNAPKVQFQPEIVCEPGKAPKTVYRSCVDEEEQKKYDDANRIYAFDGHRPTEILMVTLRVREEHKDLPNDIHPPVDSTGTLKENDFWERNGYTGNCRFIEFNILNEGKIQRTADIFELWTGVYLLAVNEIDPNNIQAYRLYSMNVFYSKPALTASVQGTVFQLLGAKNYIEKAIQQSIAESQERKDRLPEYSIDVPVVVESPKSPDLEIDVKKFALTPKLPLEDENTWNLEKNKSFELLDHCIEESEKALDDAVMRNHDLREIPDKKVQPLDKYQKAKMEADLEKLYKKILQLQSTLPRGSDFYKKKLVDKEKKVKEIFETRLNLSKSLAAFFGVALFLLVAILPALFYYSTEKTGDLRIVPLVYGVTIAVLGLTQLVCLLVYNQKLKYAIQAFNEGLKSAAYAVSNNVQNYSKFISMITTYSRGKSYLQKLSQMKYDIDSKYTMQLKHEKAINTFLDSLQTLCAAYNLDVAFASQDKYDIEINYIEKPQMSTHYTFVSGGDKEVPINKSGEVLNSEFDFIDRIIITREDLKNECGS